MRSKCLLIAVLIAVLLLSVSAIAYYHSGQPTNEWQTAPVSLVVKLDAQLKAAVSETKDGIASIGIASFDEVNEKHRVISQEFLFPVEVRRKMPGELTNMFVIDVPIGENIIEMQADYEKLDFVEFVEPDYFMELYEIPDDPLYPHQWLLNNTGQGCYHVERYDDCNNDSLILAYGNADADIDALEVHENPPDRTKTVVVAIVDTGVDSGHPDLQGRIYTNINEIPDNGVDDDHNGYIDDVHGWDFNAGLVVCGPLLQDNDPNDERGHGTHCAGIVTAVSNNGIGIAGIADNCLIMPLRAGRSIRMTAVIRGIVYAADNGADIISLSLGSDIFSIALEEGVNYALSKGVIVCASSGNDGREKNNYPAALDGVITVGATNNLDEVTDFSTYGSHVEICAPGQSVLSLRAAGTDLYGPCESNVHVIDYNYYLASGTSMSCPTVAGALAMLLSVSPGLTAEAAQEIMENAADDIIDPYGEGDNYPGYDIYSGYGRVNVKNMVDAAPGIWAAIEYPRSDEVIDETITITGYADGDDFAGYVLEYGAGNDPDTWTEINSSSGPVTNGILGSWNTLGLNSQYTLRLRVGELNIVTRTVYVVNISESIADITNHFDGEEILPSSRVVLRGRAACPDFLYYSVEFGIGEDPLGWEVIISTAIPVVNEGELAIWNAGKENSSTLQVRLSVYSNSGLEASETLLLTKRNIFSAEYGWKTSVSGEIPDLPNYGDFDNDGFNEIIVGTETGLYFYDTEGNLKTAGMPVFPSYNFRIPIAVGNLDDDGIDDFVAIGVYNEDESAILYGHPSSEPAFEIDLITPPMIDFIGDAHHYINPKIILRDSDDDGKDEIHYYTGGRGIIHSNCSDNNCDPTLEPTLYYIYETDGTLDVTFLPGDTLRTQFLSADINKDGLDEIYRSGNVLECIDRFGNVLDSAELKMDKIYFRTNDISAVDIDRDSKLEIVVFGALVDGFMSTGVSSWRETGNFWIFAFDENLDLMPGWPHNTGIDIYYVPTEPIFCDVNSDRVMEYFMTCWDLESAYLSAWNIDGTPLGNTSSDNGAFGAVPYEARICHPLIADMDGNGSADIMSILENDPFIVSNFESIIAWDNESQLLDNWPLVTETVIGMGTSQHFIPVTGDINNDGYLDVMMLSVSDKLIFTSFPEVAYYDSPSQVTYWRYNRNLDNICPLITICTDSDDDGYGDPGHPENECPDDNCPSVYNPDQTDLDNDGMGDYCDDCTDPDEDGFGYPGLPSSTCPDDNCPFTYNPDQTDTDGDGVGDSCDNCIDVVNPGQADSDGDGIGNLCDACTDSDGDGYGDPGYELNTCPEDNCPDVYNPDQADVDEDGFPDSCDICPTINDPDQDDFDNDGIGDVCDECTDSDGDGFGNPGYSANTCPVDNCPDIANPGQEDADLDGFGDVCDNCPDVSNSDQQNSDDDSYGDLCDNCPDTTSANQDDHDSDGVGDICDNCRFVPNPGQEDEDENGIGDMCEWTCGDVNGDSSVNLLDITYIIRYLYYYGLPPIALEAADVNGSGQINILDITYFIAYLYAGGQDLNCQ